MPIGAPHSEFLVVGLLFLVIGVGLLTAAKFWPAGGRRSLDRSLQAEPAAARPIETSPLEEPERTIEHEPQVAALAVAEPPPTWPGSIDADVGELDVDARRRVLAGLGIVGDEWSAGILAQALDEERGAMRVGAIEAIGMCDVALAAPMLELAYASASVEERYAAVDGASRRADSALLERALHDADDSVALAAAYGLRLAGRDELVAAGLGSRGDAQGEGILQLLQLLG